jgi:hypothetical protein
MRKKLAAFALVGALAGGVVATNVTASQATDPITRLTRQVRSLQNQVNGLRVRVGDLEHLVYRCDFYDSSDPVTFSDGTVGYPLYANPAC